MISSWPTELCVPPKTLLLEEASLLGRISKPFANKLLIGKKGKKEHFQKGSLVLQVQNHKQVKQVQTKLPVSKTSTSGMVKTETKIARELSAILRTQLSLHNW